jgi:hypothetical protein
MWTKITAAFATALTLGAASTAMAGTEHTDNRGGFVITCSLDGVNPVYHPRIFGNPAVAREYGFVKTRDSGWQVEKICIRGPYHN